MATELEKIADQAKRDKDVATAVFALTLEQMTSRISEMNLKLDELGGKYVTVQEYDNLKERVKALETVLKGVIAFVFIAVGGALLGLIIQSGAK